MNALRDRTVTAWLLAACAALSGCAPKTNVSTTANVPAAYSHVYLSVREIWFNTSASATPQDTTWLKYPLREPVTVDLAGSVGGAVSSLTSGLAVPVGTYEQIRLIPVDSGATLLSSAKNLGARYNSEVDYVDADNVSQQLALELQNPDAGIGIQTSVRVRGDSTNVFVSSSAGSSNTASVSASTTATSTSSTSSSSSKSAPVSIAINVDGAKDLVPFSYGSGAGTSGTVKAMLLNPHLSAYDTSAAGAIQGTLNLANLTGISSASSSLVAIQVTAESLSQDGTRHVVTNSTPVKSDGSFTLYPLSTTSSSPTSYDLVIHGPAIATIVLKDVAVTPGDPASTTPVNVGTLTPRPAASFLVNLDSTTPLPAGALVGFYQTLRGSNEVPYVIEEKVIDPFSRTFAADQAISAADLDYATYSASSSVSLTTAEPAEGAGTYRVSATAPLFSDGVLTTTVTAPRSRSGTTLVAVPALSVAAGVASSTTTVTIGQSTANRYDQGDLIISHDGAIVATAPLDALLARSGGGRFVLAGIPSGGGTTGIYDQALYYVSVRAWNSADPAGTLVRETYSAPLDLRSSFLGSYSLTID